MERKPTRPSPVPGTSKKKKSDLSLTSSRQAVDLTDVSQNLRGDDGGKTDNTEKEKAARLESPDLVWLEENATDYLDQKERNHESVQQPYPFHPSETLRVLIPEAEVGPRYCKGPVDRCRVGCTTETAHSILPKLTQNTHPKVRAKSTQGRLRRAKSTQGRCKCGRSPPMKVSRTRKNFYRMFLTCDGCGYFRWMDSLDSSWAR